MVITRWDPVRGVVAFQNPFNTLFRDLNEGEGTQDHGQLYSGG